MAKKFLTSIDLNQNELQYAVVHALLQRLTQGLLVRYILIQAITIYISITTAHGMRSAFQHRRMHMR